MKVPNDNILKVIAHLLYLKKNDIFIIATLALLVPIKFGGMVVAVRELYFFVPLHNYVM